MASHQLGFDFARPKPPSATQVELAAARARARSHGALESRTEPSSSSAPRLQREAGESPALPGLSELSAQTAAPEPDALPAIPGTELAAALELALRARCGGPLRLTVTDNRRTMLSLHKRKELIEVRLHHMFLRAPAPVWDALSDYLFAADRAAAAEIARYIEQQREHIRRSQERPLALSTAGAHHDLHAICRDINLRYFEGQADVHITWGRSHTGQKTRAARRSIKLGSYTARERLIRVHPALDAAFVPRFFVEYIVYHEMLHHVLPPTVHNGRRDLHGPEFQRRERKFEQYQAALAWERENLDRLLRKRAQRPRSRL